MQRLCAFSIQSELSTPNSAPHASNGKQNASTGTREVVFALSDLSTADLSSPVYDDPALYNQVTYSGHTVLYRCM
jgi:hypothetical protein